MFKFLFARINRKDKYNRTKLHFAADCNNISLVESLLTQGAKVNVKDKDGMTPLHYAAYNNHLKVSELLLKNGADVHARDHNDKTPFYYMVESGSIEIIQLFLNYGANFHTLDKKGKSLLFQAACINKNVEVVQLLIDLGLAVDHSCIRGRTFLHWACSSAILSGNIKILKCLIKNGANMNAVDKAGFIPAIYALELFDDFEFNKKMKIKIFHFIIEHTDFTIIDKNAIMYLFKSKHGLNLSRKIILQHLAKLETLKLTIHVGLLSNILQKRQYNEYFEQCKDEILRAKNTKLQKTWISFYDLLINSKRKLKNYVANIELIENFEKSDCIKNFPIYGTVMTENVKYGIERRKLFDESVIALSHCLPIFNPNHLIITDVLDCLLSKKDLSKLCK